VANLTQSQFNINIAKELSSSSSNLRRILVQAQAPIPQGGGISFFEGQRRSAILSNVPGIIQQREQAANAAVINKQFGILEKDLLGKITEALTGGQAIQESIESASANFDIQLGNFQQEQADIERGIITSQSQVNMGSQNNLLLIAAVVAGVFFLG